MGGEFLEGEFFRGLFCCKKQSQKIRLKNSGAKFGCPKFVSQNSALNSGSGGAKSPVQTLSLLLLLPPEGLLLASGRSFSHACLLWDKTRRMDEEEAEMLGFCGFASLSFSFSTWQ